jgi:hypothetical protein
MHYSWPILRLAWSAAIVVYLVLCMIPGRVSSWEKRFNNVLFIAVVALVWIRIFGRYFFHHGLIFQYALVLAGFVAGIGILFRIKALTARFAAEGEESDSMRSN